MKIITKLSCSFFLVSLKSKLRQTTWAHPCACPKSKLRQTTCVCVCVWEREWVCVCACLWGEMSDEFLLQLSIVITSHHEKGGGRNFALCVAWAQGILQQHREWREGERWERRCAVCPFIFSLCVKQKALNLRLKYVKYHITLQLQDTHGSVWACLYMFTPIPFGLHYCPPAALSCIKSRPTGIGRPYTGIAVHSLKYLAVGVL